MTRDAEGQPAKKAVDAGAIISHIKAGRWRKEIETIRAIHAKTLADTGEPKAAKKAVAALKKELPGVMFAGTFSQRGNTYLQNYSGLLCVDLDNLERFTIEAAFAKAKEDPHVVAAFRSPTDSGLKILFAVSGTSGQHDNATFRAVRKHVLDCYGLAVDESCKNLERLCFVSFDPQAFWHDAAAPLPLAEAAMVTQAEPAPAAPEIETRRRIAGDLLGTIQWTAETKGFCTCPGQHLHTTGNGERDCEVHLDGSPTVHCFHNSCAGIREGVNHSLRSRIGKAEKKRKSRTHTAADYASDLRGAILRIVTLPKESERSKRELVADAVLSALQTRGKLYYHAERRDFDSAMFFDSERARLVRVRSDEFKAFVSEWTALNRSDRYFDAVLAAIETAALAGQTATPVLPAAYWHARPGAIYLSNGDGKLVRITAESVDALPNGTDEVLFGVGQTLAPWKLTTPRDPLDTCAMFRDIQAAAPHGKDLFRLWMFSLPTAPRSKPPVVMAGEVGSGKTRLAEGAASLYGLPIVTVAVEERTEADFWPAADAGGLLTLDNADTRTRWLSDAVATAATGGCVVRRRLYTNSDRVTLRANAWLALTTANPTFANDPGLADRLLVIRMNRREGTIRDTELFDEIAAHRDAGLSFIANTLRAALADTQPTPDRLNARHPDFASFAVRIGRAIGRESAAVAALTSAESDKHRFCLENDYIGSALLAYMEQAKSFDGTAAELLECMAKSDPDLREHVTPKKLGKRLASLWPHVASELTAARQKARNGVTMFSFASPKLQGLQGFKGHFPKVPHESVLGDFSEMTASNPANPASDSADTDPYLQPDSDPLVV